MKEEKIQRSSAGKKINQSISSLSYFLLIFYSYILVLASFLNNTSFFFVKGKNISWKIFILNKSFVIIIH